MSSMRAFARAKAGAQEWTGSPRGVCGVCYKCKRRMRQCCCYEDRSLAKSISEHVNMFAETNLGADVRSKKFDIPVSRQTASIRHFHESPASSPVSSENMRRVRNGSGSFPTPVPQNQKDDLVPSRFEDSRKRLTIAERVSYDHDDPRQSNSEAEAASFDAQAQKGVSMFDSRAPDAFEASAGLEFQTSMRGHVPSRFGQRPQTAAAALRAKNTADVRERMAGTPSAHLASSSHSAYRDWKDFDFLREPKVEAFRNAKAASGLVPGQPVRPYSATGSATRPGTTSGYTYRPPPTMRREGRARGEFWGVNDTYDGAQPFGEDDGTTTRDDDDDREARERQRKAEEQPPSKAKVDELVRQLRVLCYRKVRCGGGDVSVREIFRRFDANKDGAGDQEHQGIDLAEFTDAMKRLMLGTAEEGLITDKQARHLFMRLDKDHDGTIDFRETAMSLSLPGWDNKVLGRKSNVLL